MLYKRLCPFCQSKLVEEDIDYNFDGSQDEMSRCENCKITFEFKIRYHNICNKFAYSEDNEKWKTGYLNQWKNK